MKRIKRKYPIGAEITQNGVHFRIWAPDHDHVEIIIENSEKKLIRKMRRERGGYFSLFLKEAKEGSLYRFRLSSAHQLDPDPASRYQPEGPAGPSCVMSSRYAWKNKWKGVGPYGHVAYEMHIGTFTKEGTFQSAMRELPRLAELGVTLLEIMPLNEFPGHFGWGYDGVNLFAPSHLYGTPNDVKAFIDTAHGLGLGVILDVVYNHFGPEENRVIRFSEEFLNHHDSSDWGASINFDHPSVREFFLTNARYWIEEFHFDGLRVDATSWLKSTTKTHILEDITRSVKKAGGKRGTLIIGENEPQNVKLLLPYKEGGYGFDMLWNDDFHHTAHVRLTGKVEAYYTDYSGTPQEFISSLKYGYLYQGQYYSWQKQPRGTPSLNFPASSLMIYLENHDQIANSSQGMRMQRHTDLGNFKTMVALLLLSPNTPLLFQGQEFNSQQPFYYFSDHAPDLSPLIRKGRKKELSQFPRFAAKEAEKRMLDPENPLTFIESKLSDKDRQEGQVFFQFYKDLISLRKNDPVFKKMPFVKIDGAVLGNDSFLIRYFDEKEGDRILIINFGIDQHCLPCPEPLLAPGIDQHFEIVWSSESVCYKGEGTPELHIPYLKIPGHTAVLLKLTRSDKI